MTATPGWGKRAGGRRDKPGNGASSPPRVLVTGGGTGGHIYPALSISTRIRERVPGAELLYVGTAEGLEARLVPGSGLPFIAIAARGLVGKPLWQRIGGLPAVAAGLGQALAILRRFRPDVVVGTGGYASWPVAAAAVLLRVPLVIQEQNVIPGVTNRLLSRFARLVAAAFEDSRACFPRRARVVVTGNPVRPEILRADRNQARARFGLPPATTLVLVFMGSRGSATVNRALVRTMPRLAGQPGLEILYAAGESYFARVVADLRGAGLSPSAQGAGGNRDGEAGVRLGGNIVVRPYIHEMVDALAAADLVVARAGAITLAEITARGLPALLIPSPHVTHRHQERNAGVLARQGAALVLREEDLTGESLADRILELAADRRALRAMGERSRRLGRPGAVDDIVDRVLELVR